MKYNIETILIAALRILDVFSGFVIFHLLVTQVRKQICGFKWEKDCHDYLRVLFLFFPFS